MASVRRTPNKLENREDLRRFFDGLPGVLYVMEEFVEGDICSYDAITDSKCRPLFESMTVWPPSIADIVNQKLDLAYYTADLAAAQEFIQFVHQRS